MRVAFDGRKLYDFGIGTYIQGLLREFVALGIPEELVVYRPPDAEVPPVLETAACIEWRLEGAPAYSLAELWRLALRARRDRAQLFHAPHYVCPPVLACPAVVTIHDLIHLRFPDWRGRPGAPLYARVMLRLAVWRAARVITVSESTRRDLERRLGARPERIRVIPNGVTPHFGPAADPAALQAELGKLGLAPPYLLFVGNPMPHKNLGRLLDAFAGLPPALGPLVVAGVRPAAQPALERALEAMACGTPVVASDRGALPEVVGDAGVLVDPTNVDALREAMYNLAVHTPLRAALRAAGLARARAFSWRHAAGATVAVYREVLAGGPGEPR